MVRAEIPAQQTNEKPRMTNDSPHRMTIVNKNLTMILCSAILKIKDCLVSAHYNFALKVGAYRSHRHFLTLTDVSFGVLEISPVMFQLSRETFP